ncbi:MAG: GntR family transcriptional regulator [Collinsella sp.]
MPKYGAIAADIRRSIEDGALKPGDKLPTVVEFCELYSVSKITVKRAIEQITEEGLITSRRGSGTYVKDTAGLPGQAFFQGKNDRAQGFSYEHRGEKVTSVVYDFSIVNPPADIAAQLGIAEDDFAYHVVRVRQADGKPIVIEYTYMPLELIPGLKKKDLYGSLYHFIREQCGLKISSFTVPFAPWQQPRKKPTSGHQTWLSLARAHQIGFLDSGAAFEYSTSRNVGDRFELHNVTLA